MRLSHTACDMWSLQLTAVVFICVQRCEEVVQEAQSFTRLIHTETLQVGCEFIHTLTLQVGYEFNCTQVSHELIYTKTVGHGFINTQTIQIGCELIHTQTLRIWS